MSYQVLYRAYRPSKFSEVVGQEYIIKTLINAIKNNKIAHAYLFAGPRGTGKTTIAKLFAKAINCEHFENEACDECSSCLAFKENNHPDIIELDAASNNSVDDIREIIEQVPYAPMLGKYKVYIIDEVHMLSASAFNALLKTLEEPPAHVVFILATTDPQKIIPTVLSRCQRYNFSKISIFNMKKKMIEILNKENIEFEDKAIEEIAILAEGGMRDALSILEQMLSYNNNGVYLEDVRKVFGLSSSEEKVNLLLDAHNNITQAISLLREMYNAGIDIKRLAIDLLEIIKEALIYSDGADETLLNKLNTIQAKDILDNIGVSSLIEDINYIETSLSKTKGNQNFVSYFELALVKMSKNLISRNKNTKEVKKEIVIEKPQAIGKEIIKQEPKKIEKEIVEEKANTIVKENVIKEEYVEPVVQETYQTEDTSVDLTYLAGLLLTANKNDKISDSIIYNRLDMYKFEPDKRKFYELLKDTKLFASGKDVIIVVGPKLAINNINSREMKNDLYQFLLEELGIDKVVYGIYEEQQAELVSLYKKIAKEKDYVRPIVKKPVIQKELTNEEKVKQLFDNVRIEE